MDGGLIISQKKSKSDYLRALLAKLKAAAALKKISLGDYIKDMSEAHVQELEKKGLLPKGK
jgi:hypothetical protein